MKAFWTTKCHPKSFHSIELIYKEYNFQADTPKYTKVIEKNNFKQITK